MKSSLTPSTLSLAIALGLGLATASAAEPKAATEATSPAPVYTAKEMEGFITLAKETVAALDGGKNTEMIAKLTDLETAWDAQEETLKPKDPATWTSLDKTLDKSISALRSSKTDIPKGKAALEDLIKKLKQATKP